MLIWLKLDWSKLKALFIHAVNTWEAVLCYFICTTIMCSCVDKPANIVLCNWEFLIAWNSAVGFRTICDCEHMHAICEWQRWCKHQSYLSINCYQIDSPWYKDELKYHRCLYKLNGKSVAGISFCSHNRHEII